jgi:hypothetical protein
MATSAQAVFRSALLLTLAGAALLAILGEQTAKPFAFWSAFVMYVLGFTHFAVGYLFMLQGTSRLTLRWPETAWTIAAVVAGLCYYYPAFSSPAAATLSLSLLYTVTFCHFAENAVYQLYRRPPHTGAIAREAIFPCVVALVALRGISLWRDGSALWANGMSMAAFLVAIRSRLPRPDWRAGGRVLVQNPLLAGLFATVAIFAHERTSDWNLFIIWHYLTWIVYQWSGAAALRSRLVWSHVAFGGLYLVLNGGILLALTALPRGIQTALIVVAGPVAFYAQTMAHNLITLVFRQYAAPP